MRFYLSETCAQLFGLGARGAVAHHVKQATGPPLGHARGHVTVMGHGLFSLGRAQ